MKQFISILRRCLFQGDGNNVYTVCEESVKTNTEIVKKKKKFKTKLSS